jgi:prepilin-type N-terminal cleavage/methylation domain-containing protein
MSRRPDGFTLIELMIVVTIMGTMAAMIVPGISEFLADARAASASEALVRMFRHMQARTQQTGLAHLLIFGSSNNDGGGLGVVRVWEGMNNHCRQTPWADTTGGRDDEGHAPVDVLDLSSGDYNPTGSGSAATSQDRDRQVISLRVSNTVGGGDSAVICVEPGGAVWEGAPANALGAGFAFTKPIASKAIVFTVTRKLNDAVRGQERRVLFSTSGIARFKF